MSKPRKYSVADFLRAFWYIEQQPMSFGLSDEDAFKLANTDNEALTFATFRPCLGVGNPCFRLDLSKTFISLVYEELKTLCASFPSEDILKVVGYITNLTPVLDLVVNLLQLILKNEEPDISTYEATRKLFPSSASRFGTRKRTLAGFWPASYCPTPLWLAITEALFPFSLDSQKERVFCMKNWWDTPQSRSALVGTRFEKLDRCDCPVCIEQSKAVPATPPVSEFDALSREELIGMIMALRKAQS